MKRLAIVMPFCMLICINHTIAQVYAVPLGKPPARFVLPDSSSLWLNSGSQALVNINPSGKHLQLSGEGFLMVHPFGSRRFAYSITSTGANEIKMNTSTNVFISNYKEDRYTKISTTTGKVRVNTRGSSFVVTRRRFLQIDQKVAYGLVDYWTNDTAFVSGWMQVDNRPGYYLINEFCRYYGLTAQYEYIPNRWVTCGYSKPATIKQAMDCFSNLSRYFEYAIKGDTIIIVKPAPLSSR